MPRTTNDYSQSVDFIKAIANIAEPFNSTLLDNYKEYQHDISDYIENDERECFLSILQKSGQDGCSKIYDGIVNYIDDVSNIDTSIPSALLSQANSLGYPYKDKSTVNKLAQLTSTNSILQNLVWAFSVSKNNAPIILDRLGLTSTDTELSNTLTIDEIYAEISGAMVDELETLFNKKYLYLDYDSEGTKDIIVAESDFSLLDFSWLINSIYDEEIISNGKTLSYFNSIVLDFGKYNRTIYSIICYDYLYDLLFSYSAENLDKSTYTKTALDNIARKSMPFVYDSSLFDPIQAAWSIEYNAAKIEDFDSIYHEQITKFQSYFKKLNHIANDKLINKYDDSKDFKFIPRLNAYSFSYQQLILELFVNVKNLFGIDIKDYIDFDINDIDYWNDLSTMDKFNKGFAYYEFVDRIDFGGYLEKLSNAILELAKKIKILREDLRIMTLRNSFKGTAALIQFSTIEYLKECIGDIIYQAQSEISDESKKLTREQIIEIENDISATTQSDVGVDEYWDYTEYFGRVDNNIDNDGVEVDWKLPREGFVSYGTTTEDDIMAFYTDVLHIPKNIYFEYNGNLNNNSSSGYYIDSGEDAKRIRIRQFLATVYNSGVFTKRTDDNYESIYYGNVKETTNESPWINYKNKKYISKEIHPYIWNFTNKIVNRLYKSGAITTAIQDTEYTLVNALIDTNGNILEQFRLSENFIDSSGYITRYEHRDHGTKEVLQSYDGVVYPEFGYKFISAYPAQISTLDSEFYQKWYVDQSNALTEYGQERELENLSHEHDNIKRYMEDRSLSDKALKWYCIDNYETSYAINPINNQFYYKENGYPFMRPLIRFDENGHNLGMMLVDAEDNIITSKDDIDFDFSDGYDLDNDAFPPIYVSQDGTHILIRLNQNLIGSFKTTMHRNHLNEMEKALKVNAIISCPDIMFDKDSSNDSLIKSKDDDFYILRQTKSGNRYVAQLYYIKKDFKYVKAASQTINGLSSNDLIESGLFLNGGQNVIIDTYYVNSNLKVDNSLQYSGALDLSNTTELINGITEYGNINNPNSSYDVLQQFVQMYSSKLYSGQGTNSDFAINKFDVSNAAYPSIDIRSVEYANTNVSITDKILAKDLRFSTTFPFSRQFNINSDAGFNPVYIGTNGRIILEKRTQQFKYTKTIGGAFELLGPQNDFETDNDPDNPDDSDNDNQDLLRIHELFSEKMPVGSIEEYGKITKISSNTTYSYGYASAVEKADDKDGTYVIDSIVSADFSIISSDYSIVETENLTMKNISTGQNSRIYIFLGVNDKLYSLMPRRKSTLLQDTTSNSNENTLIYNALTGSTTYTMQFKNTYLIDSIIFSKNKAKLKGKNNDAHEFLNATLWLINVVSTTATQSPNFMLPTINLINALDGDDTDDIIDAHLRVPHLDNVKSYVTVSEPTDTDLNSYELENVSSELSSGSLVFSIIEVDSEKMNHSLPDQVGPYNIKSVTTEAMNDYLKYVDYNGHFDTLSYDFRPFIFHNLNLEREIPADIEIGYENSSSTSIDDQYIVQPYEGKITINQNSANKYTISFWRSKEKQTPKNSLSFNVENTVPRDVKTTEITGSKANPIYGIDKESLADLINDASFVPQLCVQWKYKNGNDSDPIELKFNNSTAYDSVFMNPNSGLEYKSLSQFKESIILLPGEQKYIDIVAPNHIRVGMTVFYDIPIIRALVTNISDNKPKFMLTLLNDRADSTVALESNNYALVFTSNSTPQLTNNDKTYVQCYVAPIVSANQQNPPSVSNALALSELAFSMDIANILNAIDKELFTANDVNVIAPNDKISETAAPAVSFANGTHQVRIAEPYDSSNMGFSIVDIKLNLIGLSEYTLKNALVSAHGNVIAYDINGNACPITKIFGTSLDRIGRKNVLGVIDNENSKPRDNVATVTQNSGRKTAIQVNPKLNS